MRLYIDEDLASKELLARLTVAGNDVVATRRGISDAEAWALAQDESAVLVTANVRDFVQLASAAQSHGGLLLVFREADARRNLTFAGISDAVARVQSVHGTDLTGRVLALNHYGPAAAQP